jgi:4-hydroxybutyrate CoA-transferase
VPVTDIDWFVEADTPLPELSRPNITDIEKEIGRHIESLIRDGDTLQLGIGSLPDAALLFLKNKKDLGIHSEMISDGVMELMLEGVVTNKRKTLFPGKAVVTFFAGTRAFYDFVDDNPVLQMMPADFVNDPYVIARNDNMASINSCVSVDFYGQIASESIGKTQISGVGGQVDFTRGANMSKNGRAIIAIQSTTKNGEQSKIVPFFEEGTPVSTGRFDSRYIVTEYGVAYMRGKKLHERAKALIEIAHPKFRPQLIEEWEKYFCRKYH